MVRDNESTGRVVQKVYRAEEIYSGPVLQKAPDMIIGYNRGYRVSWESVLGKFTKAVMKDNNNKWSGDHAMAAELVPGVILANKKISSSRPALYDLAPTILKEFGIPKGEEMVGDPLF